MWFSNSIYVEAVLASCCTENEKILLFLKGSLLSVLMSVTCQYVATVYLSNLPSKIPMLFVLYGYVTSPMFTHMQLYICTTRFESSCGLVCHLIESLKCIFFLYKQYRIRTVVFLVSSIKCTSIFWLHYLRHYISCLVF